MSRQTLILLLTLFITIQLPLFPGNEWVDITLWHELEPLVQEEGTSFPVPQAKAMDRLLEEARIIFSYMIYGGAFFYTPSDISRKVEELFEIAPSFEIKWGDPHLQILSSQVKERKLEVILRYNLEEFQALRIKAWESQVYTPVTSSGEGDLFKGYKARIEALEEAVKQGIREHLRKTIYNKPSRIAGLFLLSGAPSTRIKAGKYISQIRIRLKVEKIVPYTFF